MSTIPRNLRAAIEKSGYTQRQLCGALRISTATMQYWLTGRHDIPAAALAKICSTIGASMDQICGLKKSSIEADLAEILKTVRKIAEK